MTDPRLGPALHGIEFVGLACSGKSALADRLSIALQARRIPFVSRAAYSNAALAPVLARHPGRALAWWRVARRYVGDRSVRRTLFREACMLTYESLHWADQKMLLVRDEGLFQLLRSLRRASETDLTLDALLANEPFDLLVPPTTRMVVLVEIDVDTLIRRARDRDGRVVTPVEAVDAVGRVDFTRKDIAALRSRLPETHVVSVRNDLTSDLNATVERLSAEVADRITKG